MQKLHFLNEKARDDLLKSKECNKFYFDKKACPSDVNIGDKVFLMIDRSRHKLEPLFEGPFDVIDVNKNTKNVTIIYKKDRIRSSLGQAKNCNHLIYFFLLFAENVTDHAIDISADIRKGNR